MPESLGLLRTLLSAPVPDLQAITDAIRGDVGLTVEVLRQAAEQPDTEPANVLNLAEIVVHLGLEKLRAVISKTPALPAPAAEDAVSRRIERFWMHARLTALVAEELACRNSGVSCQDAYVAGLLRHLGALPFVLDWHSTDCEPGASGELGYYLAKGWSLPEPLTDVIRGDRDACISGRSRSLLDLANAADKHAYRLELGCY